MSLLRWRRLRIWWLQLPDPYRPPRSPACLVATGRHGAAKGSLGSSEASAAKEAASVREKASK